LLSLLLASALPGAARARQAVPDKVDFTRDIRPILANQCLLCHGPDPKDRKGDLRLDTREGALADLGGHAAIVPGKPDQSELLKRVTATDPDDVMPPKKTGKKLGAADIAVLRRWIEQGAPYAKHWAFVKPERPAVPAVKHAAWPRNDVDRFLLARLEKEGLRPSPEADRTALVRRLALDLTGLPPTIEEADAFAADKDPAAYEKLVDRLLASPHFGERWGKVWLDLARYADSQGYAEDRPRVIWPFRDWVIRALNENLPFDRFTIEQLAGDLLPNPTEGQLQATGFHRNTLTNTEGGTDDEEFRNFAVVDRVNTTMQVWMGLTMACAQCHNHKFDPISQEEYFRVFAFLNQTEDNDAPDDRPFLPLYSDEQKRERKELEDSIAKLEALLGQPSPELEAGQKKWEAGYRRPAAWKPVRTTELKASAGSALAAAADGSILASGAEATGEAYTVRAASDLTGVSAVRLEALTHPSLPIEGPGRAKHGVFLLSRFAMSVAPSDAKPPSVRFVRLELPGSQRYLHVAEVEVKSGGANVATRGKASQSSTDFGGEAKRAIDGNTNGDYHASNSVTHTAAEDNPWLEVDLGKETPVEQVSVWHRTDGGQGVTERIKGFKVRLLGEDRKAVEERTFDAVAAPKSDWSLSGIRTVAFRAAFSERAPKESPAANLVKNADPKKNGWNVPAGKPGDVVLIPEKPLSFPAGSSLVFTLDHVAGKGALGAFRISLAAEPEAAAYAEVPADVHAILAKAERSKEEAGKLAAYYRSIAPERAGERAKLADAKKRLEGIKPAGTVPILKELPAGRGRKTQVQVRGNFLVKGAEVKEGVPSAFHPLPEQAPKNRLGLALWIVHPDNPLTARVAVNRHWEQVFGQGLMSTSEEWGVRGEIPSHPELLDWLAIEFVRSGWDMKKLIRLLVSSAAYRQSSQVTPALLAKDPSNRLLARGPRVRLAAEFVRDQALAASGLLSRKMFGPSVYPPQPKMGLNAAFSSSLDWQTSQGEDKFRRGIYTFWRRSVTYPSMATFDAPDRNVCTVKRVPTNTPLQALVMMNDPVYVEAAQGLGRRIVAEGGKDARARATYGFRRCLARPPREAELERLVALYEEMRGRYAKDPARAKAMATEPIGPAPEGADPVELAAWTVVGNVLLNLDEMFLKR
jgi:hypothetical protein